MKALRYVAFGTLFFGIWAIAANEMNAQAKAFTTANRLDDLQVCDSVEPDLADDSARWRLRAYNNLDCLIGRIDHALKRSRDARNSAEIKVSREELEQLRTLAWWAKDAAARIGR